MGYCTRSSVYCYFLIFLISLIKYDGDTAIDKKTFTAMIKRYLVQLKKELEKTKPDRVKAFQAEAQAYIGEILKDFGNCEFYHGQIDYDVQEHKLEAMKQECKEAGGDPETVKPLQEQIVVLRWIDGSIPTFHFFTDGMRSEKC